VFRLHALLSAIFIGLLVPVTTGGCTASRGAAPQFGAASPPQNAIQSAYGGASGGASLFSFLPAQGGSAVAASYSEPVQTADPTSLSTEAKPSPRLYVAMAKLHEKSNQLDKAEEQYRRALQMDARYLDALLGLGRLKDRKGHFKEALDTYQRAVKYHPQNAAAWNHLGLCLARQGRLSEAADALQRAVNLEPRQELYRTNLAVIFVEAGHTEDALRHLQAVHDEAQAYYNLGYLLQKKGDTAAAARYFNLALQRKPDFEEARQWLESLRTRNDNSLIAEEAGMGRSKQRVSLTGQLADASFDVSGESADSHSFLAEKEDRSPRPFSLPFFGKPSNGPSDSSSAGAEVTQAMAEPNAGNTVTGSWSSLPRQPASSPGPEGSITTSRSAPPRLGLPASPRRLPNTGNPVAIESPKIGSVVAPLPPVLAEPATEVQPLPPITSR